MKPDEVIVRKVNFLRHDNSMEDRVGYIIFFKCYSRYNLARYGSL